MTWRVGDLAVCICRDENDGIILVGDIVKVSDILFRHGECGLCFFDKPNEGEDWLGWKSENFRKVIKDGTTETEKTSIKDLLKTGETA